MELGAFSVSLTVKDLAVSQAFYEKLGFRVTGGDPEQNYLILASGRTIIGLFHGMFDSNILTFNPGLDNDMEQVVDFTDVRELQATLEANGIELGERVADDNPEGPAHITLIDPDGNAILIDQFF
jgi:catechol 2,3-dioxygenase-like lactoylglutathione lyase family enzyme